MTRTAKRKAETMTVRSSNEPVTKQEGIPGEGDMDDLFDTALPVRKRREILDALVAKAVNGDLRVAGFLFDRLYGRAGNTRKTAASEPESSRFDVRRLSEKEFKTLDRLLRKCEVRTGTSSDTEGVGGAEPVSAVSTESERLREGGVESPVVA